MCIRDRSGGGKTTLAGLISRFFDPQNGSVIIGGVNVRNIEKHELMNYISFVFQNSRLIKASVLDNVRLGRPKASREEVIKALEKAQCMDIIEKLPNGIDTCLLYTSHLNAQTPAADFEGRRTFCQRVFQDPLCAP